MARLVPATLLALAPMVALALSPWHGLVGLMVLGMLPALTAAAAGARQMLIAGSVIAATGFLAVLATGFLLPVTGTLLVVVLALIAGGVTTKGYQPVGAGTVAFAAYIVIDSSRVEQAIGGHISIVAAAFAVFAAVGGMCAWVLLVRVVFLRGLHVPTTPPMTTLPYGVLLAGLCGSLTLVCLIWFQGTNAWWSVLTVSLILQPTQAETRKRLNNRILGTVLGGTAAAVIVTLFPGSSATTSLGMISALLLVYFSLSHAPYWMCTTATTVTVIMLTFQPNDALSGDLERVGITLGSAAMTALAVWLAAKRMPLKAYA